MFFLSFKEIILEYETGSTSNYTRDSYIHMYFIDQVRVIKSNKLVSQLQKKKEKKWFPDIVSIAHKY